MDLQRVLHELLGELRAIEPPQPVIKKRTPRQIATPAPSADVQNYLGSLRADMLGLGRRPEDAVEE
jgi:hypothetical protein